MIFEKTSRQGSIVAWARKSLCSGAEKDHALTCKYQAVGTLHNQHTHFVMRNKIATRTCVSWTWQSVEYIGPFPLFLRPFRGLIKLLIIPTVNKYFFQDGPIFFLWASINYNFWKCCCSFFLEIPVFCLQNNYQLCGFFPTSLLFREPVKNYLAEFFV